jgi:hypothetical protein
LLNLGGAILKTLLAQRIFQIWISFKGP